MPLEVTPIVPEDASAIAHVQATAFQNDPLNDVLFSGITYEQRADGVLHQVEANAENPSITYLKVTDTATNQIISMSRWEFKNVPSHQEAENAASKRNGQSGLEATSQQDPVPAKRIPYKNINWPLSAAINAKISAAMADAVQTRPLLQLCILGTLPAHERRGAASLQLKWGMKVAREQGLVLWLDASPVGLGLYTKLGFGHVADVVTDLTQFGGKGTYTHVCMVWERS